MYAVIEVSGRQHQVKMGERVRVDLMSSLKKGDSVVLDKVLMLNDQSGYRIGAPYVANACVKATVMDMGKDGEGVKAKKVYAFKKRRRKGFHKLIGHRQRYTDLVISAIEG